MLRICACALFGVCVPNFVLKEKKLFFLYLEVESNVVSRNGEIGQLVYVHHSLK